MDIELWKIRARRLRDTLLWKGMELTGEKPVIETLHYVENLDPMKQDEFVKRAKGPVYMEPKHGYLITEQGVLIKDSVQHNAIDKPKKSTRIFLSSMPEFIQTTQGKGMPIKHLPRMVSLRYLWEWNYYHFYLDVLGKLELLDRAGVDRDIPIVLGEFGNYFPFVKEILSHGTLKDRNWIFQEDVYLCADEVIYCHTTQPYKTKVDHLLDLMGLPEPDVYSQDRVFLNRWTGCRQIANIDEIRPIFEEYGFRDVDTAKLPIAAQIGIFSNARYLAAIHGAGMTNLVYRQDAPLSVLEIHVDGFASPDFRNMLLERGHYCDRLSGKPAGNDHIKQDDIILCPHQLTQHLEALLKSGPRLGYPSRQISQASM